MAGGGLRLRRRGRELLTLRQGQRHRDPVAPLDFLLVALVEIVRDRWRFSKPEARGCARRQEPARVAAPAAGTINSVKRVQNGVVLSGMRSTCSATSAAPATQ